MTELSPHLKFDFLLIPSLEELEDRSSDDLYLCSLAPLYMSAIALENECRDVVNRWEDITISRPENPMGDVVYENAPSEVILTMAAWIGSAAGISFFYKLIKMWAGLRKGRRIIIKLPRGSHIEATHVSPRQFRKLMKTFAEMGMGVERPPVGSQRIASLPEEKEVAFQKFLKFLAANGTKHLSCTDIDKIEGPLRTAFMHAMQDIRGGVASLPHTTSGNVKKQYDPAQLYLSSMKNDMKNNRPSARLKKAKPTAEAREIT